MRPREDLGRARKWGNARAERIWKLLTQRLRLGETGKNAPDVLVAEGTKILGGAPEETLPERGSGEVRERNGPETQTKNC